MRWQILICMVAWSMLKLVEAPGLMILYRPRDVSNDCAGSRNLRFDLSYGMGMSDTITLVFRTLYQVDYECIVDIVPESEGVVLIIVVQYPGQMKTNCVVNRDAITVLEEDRCYRLCDFVKDQYTTHVVYPNTGRLRFRFMSNTSSNAEINAYMYQVTATAARPRPGRACAPRNETNCSIHDQNFCFTSGVVCDGIMNCGVPDWFDERKQLCDLPLEKLGLVPVLAVAAGLLCSAAAAGRLLLRCLPTRADSFFIFNANEDNRLCIDPVFKPRTSPRPEPESARKTSLIPVFASSSSDSVITVNNVVNDENVKDSFKAKKPTEPESSKDHVQEARRKMSMKILTAKIQQKLRLVTGSRIQSAAAPGKALEKRPADI